MVVVSKNLLPNLRNKDVLARIGGEEFAIVLPDTDMKQASIIAERIRQQQDNISFTGDWPDLIQVRVSVGVAAKLKDDLSFDVLFSRADKALYTAKNNGRNQVFCFN